jgi:hypothetical protein
MLYAIAKELGQALKAQGVPFPVVFGPEPSESLSAARERIVVEQPIGEKRDRIMSAKSVHHNPTMPLVRLQAATVRIFARANLAGAAWHDHAERAEEVLDHVLAELDQIVRGRKNAWTFEAGGFLAMTDAEGSLVWSGAVYECDLTIDRGIFRRTWAGKGKDEVTIGEDVTLMTVVKVSREPGSADEPPPLAEIASGG